MLSAQFYNMPDDYFFSRLTEAQLAIKDASVHSGAKPYIPFFGKKYEHVCDSHRVYKYIVNDPGVDFVFYNHFIQFQPKGERFSLRIDPIINLEKGKDFADTLGKNLFVNTRGVVASGFVGEKVYFETMFAENQATFPNYLYNYSQVSKIIPGQGRYKYFKTGRSYDFGFSLGFISVQITKNFNFQAGHGKQKIGHGYRSLLLSDNAFNYPYSRFTAQWFKGKLQYTGIYAVLMNLTPASQKISSQTEALFQKKPASFQYLSWNVSRNLCLGFFQGMIWRSGNSRNEHSVDWQFFNPVVYSNLIFYKLNNRNNLVAGGDAKWKITDHLNVYGQWMTDDLSGKDSLGKGFGYQAGANYFDAFGLKNLAIQAEYNKVSEGSYRNVNGILTDQSYTHYNQMLGTPVRGNEFVLTASYNKSRFYYTLRYNYQDVPLNGRSYYYNHLLNLSACYLINRSYNLNLSMGYTYRKQNFYNFKNFNNTTGYFYIGLRTSLYNYYYDL